MPNTIEGMTEWTRTRSGAFQRRYFDKVLDLRNEFAQLHIRDEELDNFFRYRGMIEQANRQMGATQSPHQIDSSIQPMQIERVAERLRALADKIPQAKQP